MDLAVTATDGTEVDGLARVMYMSFPPSGGYGWYCNIS